MTLAESLMHGTPTIIQIIFYIAALLAPEGTTQMTLSPNSGDSRQFAKTASGSWRSGVDGSEWKTIGDYVAIYPRHQGGKEERKRVASLIDTAPSLVKKLRTHDWKMQSGLNFSGGLTIDKTPGGFRIHAQPQEDSPAVDLKIVYSK